MFSQISHSVSLNDICDGLRLHESQLGSIRGARAPSKNGLSYANNNRNADMAEELFWTALKDIETRSPSFGDNKGKYRPKRFKRVIHAVDATVIKLMAKSLDWAKHRRRKAAAKCHLRLDLESFLPKVAIVETAKHSDAIRAREICFGVNEGEIVLFDKAYVDYPHLFDLHKRGVFWVTRAKKNMAYTVVKRRIKKPSKAILKDEEIIFRGKKAFKDYPERLRRVEAEVEVDGKKRVMAFISNNLQWAPSSICDLYKHRWKIEVFFKEIKQTLQLCDFLGCSETAVRWQIWIALLVYVLMRYQAYLRAWQHSFTRLFTLIRGIIWDRYELEELLDRYGTAAVKFRMLATPQQAYLPGFDLKVMG